MKSNLKTKRSIIETFAQKIGLIPKLKEKYQAFPEEDFAEGNLKNYPPPEKWNDWEEYEPKGWARREKKTYDIVPTICFNCEAGCGLLAYVDKANGEIRKFEGNPWHPGSRGKNCAKGPATINQIKDIDRILYPMKRKGERGAGEWERISWEQALDEISTKLRKTLEDGRNNEIAYHVGRPGHEGYIDRILQAWGVDGHNSHTNICSSGARLGYAAWHGSDRPSPDFANAKTILLISAHLEAGHYFNPHAQRIIEAKNNGAKLIVMDTRLSNSASRADHWMPTYPGTEAAVLLAMAKVILDEGLYDAKFLRRWVNWDVYLKNLHPDCEPTLENFITKMKEEYKDYTLEFAQNESGIPKEDILEAARMIGNAGNQFAAHNWRSAASGNLGGWQVSRCLHFLSVLTGSVGTKGGTSPNDWNKFHPEVCNKAPAQKHWNELHFPDEYPLSHYEMSFLLPHFLKEGRGKLSVYFTRVFNPVWTYPDGFTWVEALKDEEKVETHIALTPTWNETAYFADYVLPMGHAGERHDLVSYETHSGLWIGFRQPVLREVAKRNGKPVDFTYQANPGEVWEEDEFWIELSWRMDPDGDLGIRKHFISPYREGEKMNIDEYYQYIFERVENLPAAAAKENLTELDYMKKYGAFEVNPTIYEKHENKISDSDMADHTLDSNNLIKKNEKVIGVMIDNEPKLGFASPSKKQEFFSPLLRDWQWPEYQLPTYIKSHIHWENIKYDNGEFPLIPTYRLPTLIHSRSGNAKWLMEISNRNLLYIHKSDADRMGFENEDLVRMYTDIGYIVIKVWATEAIRIGVLACSHHLGRWRRTQDPQSNRWTMNTVDIKQDGSLWKMRKLKSVEPSESEDPDTSRIFWNDGGVHQNIAFPVHPDPISGMHCWHQKVRVEKAQAEDVYGDVVVDTKKSEQVYKDWLSKTRPPNNKDGLRRPLTLKRPLRPVNEAFYKK